MLSLPIGLHESFILKTVDDLVQQLGLVPGLCPGYVWYYLGNFNTNYFNFQKLFI
jgi:hypothetical protein